MFVVRSGGGSNLNPYLLGSGMSFFFFFPPLKITIEAMKSDIDEVALQGIEFWSNVCDEEMDLAIEASEVSLGEGRCGKSCFSDIAPLWALVSSGKTLF